MAFSIKNDEADLLLRELTELTGESLTDAVIHSLSERLRRERLVRCRHSPDRLTAAIAHFRSLTVIDARTPGEILGYDANGLPT